MTLQGPGCAVRCTSKHLKHELFKGRDEIASSLLPHIRADFCKADYFHQDSNLKIKKYKKTTDNVYPLTSLQ